MARTIEDNQRDSKEEKELAKSMKNNKEKITRKEIKYWLGDDYRKWIHNVIFDLVNGNDMNDLKYLKYEIKKATEDSKEAHD
jgi:hypothetical protein